GWCVVASGGGSLAGLAAALATAWSGCATALLDWLRVKPERSIIGPNFGPKLKNTAQYSKAFDVLTASEIA
ncbi:MAG: hypothetical protein WA720_20900, partial [Pseudolabrys sp.]